MPEQLKKIAIVGGGIAGLYCAWKLLTEGKGKYEVTVFEALDHTGGRIETVNLNNINAECGPMRFELEIEDQFKDLCSEPKLGINFKEFTQAQGAPSSEEFPKYDLEKREWSKRQIEAVAAVEAVVAIPHQLSAMFSHHTSTLDLLKFGIYRIFHPETADRNLTLPEVVDSLHPGQTSKMEDFADEQKDTYDDPQAYDKIRTDSRLHENTIDVHPALFTFGFWNALATVLSPGALTKIRDTGTFYHLMPENPSASEWAIFWLRQSKSKKYNVLYTVEEPNGVYTIVEQLLKKLAPFEEQGIYELHLQNLVTQLDINNEKIKVKTTRGDFENFDHVILALPTGPLRTLMASLPIEIASTNEIEEIKYYIGGVIPFPLLKAFVAIKDPWWGKEELGTHHGASLVPTREIHYVWPSDGTTDRVLVMFYTDRPATAYWQVHIDPISHEKAQICSPEELERDLVRHVASVLPRRPTDGDTAHLKRVEKSIVTFAIRDWSKPPFEAACHAWKPHMNVVQALNRLKAFSLTGESNNAHICGEAYSDYQGFIEGALRSANNVIAEIEKSI